MDVHGRGVEVIFGWPWTRGGGGSPKLTFFVDVIYVWSLNVVLYITVK